MIEHPPSSSLLLALTAIGLAACGPAHLQEHEPKVRAYRYPFAALETREEQTPGSLYSPERGLTVGVRDLRALRQGDLVTVRIRERADARRGASTELSREGGFEAKLNSLLSLLSGQEIKAGTASTFRGRGSTSRTERLEATVHAMVVKVLPNGLLFIEGRRALLVNGEEHYLYISGLIRPSDVGSDNSIPSSLLAEAEIEFTGRGVLTDKQRPGWLHRGMDYISPF